MKALILASGKGTRLLPLTKTLPKSLLTLASETILERMIRSLVTVGITDIVITTGFEQKQLVAHCRQRFTSPSLSLEFCFNPDFATTNYIQSFFKAVKHVKNSDILLLHGDLVFDTRVLELLLKQKKSAMIVHRDKTTNKDFKAKIDQQRITQISTKLPPYHNLAMPLYRLTQHDLSLWVQSMSRYVDEKKLTHYAEDALNEVLDRLPLAPVYLEKTLCMEIDTPQDLQQAQEYVTRVISSPHSYA